MSKLENLRDEQAEAIVIGNMLNTIDAVNQSMDALDEGDFTVDIHIRIFRAAKELYRENRAVHPLSVLDLIRRDIPNYPEGQVYVIASYGFESMIEHYIDKVSTLGRYRKFYFLFQKAADRFLEARESPESLLNDVYADIQTVEMSRKDQIRTVGEVLWENFRGTDMDVEQYYKHVYEKAKNGELITNGVSSGYPRLDAVLSGLNNGHYIIIGARPGAGKTTFVLNMFRNMMKNNIPALFFSMEMNESDVSTMLVCQEAGISYHKLEGKKCTESELRDFARMSKAFKNIPIYVDESSNPNLSSVISRARRMVRHHGIKCIAFDYLGLIEGDKRMANNQEKVSAVSKALRALAKDLNIPFIVLCQLNRDSEKDNRPPVKSDLRESGQIEQDAHSVIMLYEKPLGHNLKHPDEGTNLVVSIEKNRAGPNYVKIDYCYDKTKGRITEYPPSFADTKKSLTDDSAEVFDALLARDEL